VTRHHTIAELAEVLERAYGHVYMAANMLGMSHQALYKRIAKSPDLAEICEKHRGTLVDTAEIQIRRLVNQGDFAAVKFVLSTLGRDRGYGQGSPGPGEPSPPHTRPPDPADEPSEEEVDDDLARLAHANELKRTQKAS